jgi:tRNA modification GTPase
MLDETIIAISTPPGYGGIGIVRLSGPKALTVARKIFRPRKKSWRELKPLTLVLGEIGNGSADGTIDEGFLAYFPAPHSYTREDVVEVSCHGSPVVLEEVVGLGVQAGARLAHPGEFTLRAYVNGRLDLIQAQAVNDLITATSLAQARISSGQIRGGLSRQVGALRGRLVELLSLIETGIEFPEEGPGTEQDESSAAIEAALEVVSRLVASYDAGRAMIQGLELAIVGRANVGKSTLFNALLDQERAIVSPHPGTTRDYLRERIKIDDALFHLTDLAGLEESDHPVEKQAVKKSAGIASEADGILLVLDSSRHEGPADLGLIRRFSDKKMILVFNKSDLPRKIVRTNCLAAAKKSPWVEVSALTGKNLASLRKAVHDEFASAGPDPGEVLLHLRQKTLFSQMAAGLEKALEMKRKGYSDELWAEEIRQILPFMGQLTGEIRADEVIDRIFSRFCIGK